MTGIVGYGGFFIRAADPAALTAWYRDVLGLPLDENGAFGQEAGTAVFAAFPRDTDYFGGSEQQAMLNLRVSELDGVLGRLRAAGAPTSPEVQEFEGIGRFGWVTDPEGNRVELWQAD